LTLYAIRSFVITVTHPDGLRGIIGAKHRIDKNTNPAIINQKGVDMIFVSMLDVIPGKVDELQKIISTIKVPKDIKIREFLSLFGKPDYILTFEASSEEKALSFILKFVSVAVPRTSLGMPVHRK